MISDTSCTRRELLALLGVAGLGGWKFSWPTASYDSLGVQLYTCRSLLTRDFEGTIKAIAAIGYREVETHDYFGRTPEAVRAVLDANGLKAAAAHVSIEALQRDLPALLANAKTVGHKWIIVPSLGGSYRTVEGYARAGTILSQAADEAADHGVRIGFHNHDVEFRMVEGQTGMDRLLAASSSQVGLELDVYWIVRAGGDPFAFIKQHADRVRALHLKDAGPSPDRKMLEVGAGTIDWPNLLKEAKAAGVEHVFVEHDNPTDALASITASYEYLRRVTRG
jgi:sugar phosphate isomerase/epimerase